MANKLPNKTRQAVYDRADRCCEWCGSNDRCQIHHIILKSQRVNHDLENLLMLCWEHHHGDYGIHGKHGADFNNELKLRLQKMYFDKGLSENEVRYKLGGKLYIE